MSTFIEIHNTVLRMERAARKEQSEREKEEVQTV